MDYSEKWDVSSMRYSSTFVELLDTFDMHHLFPIILCIRSTRIELQDVLPRLA